MYACDSSRIQHRIDFEEIGLWAQPERKIEPGAELDDWLRAQADIDREMQSGGSR